jgi:hypothetical protein
MEVPIIENTERSPIIGYIEVNRIDFKKHAPDDIENYGIVIECKVEEMENGIIRKIVPLYAVLTPIEDEPRAAENKKSSVIEKVIEKIVGFFKTIINSFNPKA